MKLEQEVANMVKITSSVAAKWLGDVPDETRFWCVDGRYLKNLSELEDAMEQMSEDTFRSHSNETKTDFSNWVKDVIGDEKLSRDLLKCSTQTQAAKAVRDRISYLNNKVSA
jgi:hypothetical protein